MLKALPKLNHGGEKSENRETAVFTLAAGGLLAHRARLRRQACARNKVNALTN